MKALYPDSHDLEGLSDQALALKIARYSPCTKCSCRGLRPPVGCQVVSERDYHDEMELLGLTLDIFDEDDAEAGVAYLEICNCGHGVPDHSADESLLGRDEFLRRARVAARMDELRQDIHRTTDFDYTNQDLESLKRQLVHPDAAPLPLTDTFGEGTSPGKRIFSPALSDLSDGAFEPPMNGPPRKRQRRSYSFSSSLSEEPSSSSDEEDAPLARQQKALPRKNGKGNAPRTTRPTGRRTGGKGMKSKAHTAPAHVAPPTDQQRADMTIPPSNGMNGHEAKVKVEDKMDESQLTRLASGVTVDAGGAVTADPATKAEKPSQIELKKGLIKVVPVENDGQPRSLVILTGLKTLFQKQLPKMPREYIARLVYDENSKCLAIIKRGFKVVGGICYRPFPHRGFAEIVFFATNSVDQVKGYGGMLMDHFKAHIRNTYPNMNHFLTYADNYAVGYFRKQGFSKEITLDRSIWAGYIKDYEGGTIMQCTMLDKVDYLQTKDVIVKQREAILEKIREKSRSHVVYPGLDWWKKGNTGPIDPKDVPGLRESGWSPSMVALTMRPNAKSPERSAMETILSELQSHPLAWAFLQPVDPEEVLDYYDYIKNPMDFSTMEHKLDTNQYATLDDFVADAKLVFENCKLYNAEDTTYHKNAIKLERFLRDRVAKLKIKREE
ncbi:unnamed protein product [Somion occarium]|uniref:histone acetyltransferase n=1 Tax=Somion occarium TaxID=3059160 RepID=A0ABP1DHI9_9APHY